MEIKIQDLAHISEAAREFVAQIGDRKVFAFYGQMGAGKTTPPENAGCTQAVLPSLPTSYFLHGIFFTMP